MLKKANSSYFFCLVNHWQKSEVKNPFNYLIILGACREAWVPRSPLQGL